MFKKMLTNQFQITLANVKHYIYYYRLYIVILSYKCIVKYKILYLYTLFLNMLYITHYINYLL